MYATSDKQTDRQTDDGRRSPLNAPLRGGGIISGLRMSWVEKITSDISVTVEHDRQLNNSVWLLYKRWTTIITDYCRSIVRRCSSRTVETWTELSWNLPADIFHHPYWHDISSRYLSQLEGSSLCHLTLLTYLLTYLFYCLLTFHIILFGMWLHSNCVEVYALLPRTIHCNERRHILKYQ